MRGEDSFEDPGSGGKAVAWAVKQAIGWSVAAAIIYVLVLHIGSLMPARPAAPAALPAAAEAPVTDALRFAADPSGSIRLAAAVDGTMVHFVVDTGANLVTLTPADAEAVGINTAGLVYSMRMSTANGETRGAPVMLRSVRLDQLTVEDVQAVVVQNVSVSLLGMSFLSRLDHWEMRGGVLTISY